MADAVMNGISIGKFYDDSAFDTNDLFVLLHSIAARSVIKIRKNASIGQCRGSKYRRNEIGNYKKKGYRQWTEENDYGMRWLGTEGTFSAVKKKFVENCVSRSTGGLEAEGYQRFWAYDYINQEAKEEGEDTELIENI